MNGIAERAAREGHLRYCCNQVWTKMVGGFQAMLLLSSEDTLRKAVQNAS